MFPKTPIGRFVFSCAMVVLIAMIVSCGQNQDRQIVRMIESKSGWLRPRAMLMAGFLAAVLKS